VHPKPETSGPDYPLREEIANSITHGLGTLLSIAGLVLLIVLACRHGNAWHVVSFTIFGSTLVLLYLASTLYHSMVRPAVKNVLARIDHSAIFLLIAGTYTPFTLTILRGGWGWSIFGVIWGLAIVGVVLRSIYLDRFRLLATFIYVGMGWLILIALPPVIRKMPAFSLRMVVIGGVVYTLGVIFYLWRKLPFAHAFWHLFVLGGSILHFLAVIYSL